MVELFSKSETSTAFRAHTEKLLNEIKSFSDEKILGADIDEWVGYYFDKYKIHPLSLFMDNIEESLSKTIIEKNNPWGDRFESKTHHIDGCKISFTIPFDGDSNLLFLRPSEFYYTTFPVDSIKESKDSSYGSIIFSLEYTKQELQGKESKNFLLEEFSNKFKYYLETIDRINNDVNQFNESLSNTIKISLEKRKQNADDYVAIGKILSIPLNINPNAPNTTQIPLKKIPMKKPEMPSIHPREENYAISNENYDNIRRIIYTTGTSMEKTAKTYSKLDEEELRDIILSHLNSHYDGTATGETFNRVGKTDIHIPFGNKAAFIAECKIWHGEKQFEQALEQLFGYTTWRDVRTSLIIFNKTNKDFSNILKTVQAYLGKHLVNQNKNVNANEWHCKFSKFLDLNETIDVQVVIFDLFIGESEAS